MAQPSYASAVLLNNLVIQLNVIKNSIDYVNALKEYALANTDIDRGLILGYGCAIVDKKTQAQVNSDIVLAKALVSYNSGDNFTTINSTEYYANLFTPLNNGNIYQDCYAAGTVYLISYESGGIQYSFYSDLVRGSNNNGSPLLYSKDIKITELEDLINEKAISYAPIPTGYTNLKTLPIYSFIIDIDYYNGDLLKSTYSIKFYDIRKQRGAFGFIDEDMNARLTPSIIKTEKSLNNQYTRMYNSLINILKPWVFSSGWSPSFAQYWQNASKPMPIELENFIFTELGVVI
jgi:hypothetical protein